MTGSDQIETGTDDELLMRLWPSAVTVGQARRAVASFCRDGTHDMLADDAELLTSELMSNACRHTGGLITLLALRNTRGLVVTVTDDAVVDAPLHASAPDTGRDSRPDAGRRHRRCMGHIAARRRQERVVPAAMTAERGQSSGDTSRAACRYPGKVLSSSPMR
jgi:anti-sigma regulatory factor (Ser/Thr protein kinase)